MTPIKRELTRTIIKESILSKILDGTFPPGYKLREVELANIFKTSQAPVREALRELESLQYVTTFPYKGTVVRNYTVSHLAEAYLMRGVIEEAAAQVIGEKRTCDFKSLREIADCTEKAAKEGDRKQYGIENARFHKEIIRLAQSELLETFWEMLLYPLQIQGALTRLPELSLMRLTEQHSSIIEAFERADYQGAGAALKAHAFEVRDFLLKLNQQEDEITK